MGGIILVIIVVFISVIVRKVAAVALRLTGLDKPTAEFQALSAFTGTGFTTRESELVLDHPKKRQIISILMIIGNAGTVAVIAGLVSSFLTATSAWAVLRFGILVVALYLIYKIATHAGITRVLSRKIEKRLKERFKLHRRTIDKILDTGDGYGVAQITLHQRSPSVGKTIATSQVGKKKFLVLAIERQDENIPVARGNHKLHAGDTLICYGSFEEMGEIT